MNMRLNTGRTTIIAAIVCLAALSVPSTARPAENDETVRVRFTCSDPDVVMAFVAARFPEDATIVRRAIRRGACRYTARGLAVTPVRFLGRVAANAAAAQRYGYVWAVRLPDRTIAYGYLWKNEHEVMREHLRTSRSARRDSVAPHHPAFSSV